MANANWSNPQLSSTYTNFVSEVKDRDEDVATQFQGTTATNIPTNAIQWDASAGRWKKWTGSAWGELASNYKLTTLEVTGTTAPANGLYLPTANTPTFTSNSAARLQFSSAGAFGLSGANYGTAGQVITSNGTGGAPTWQTPWLFSSYATICDLKPAGTAGGTFTSGAWRVRDLNTTISDPDGIVSLSSNQFTLGVGSYLIEFSAPSFGVARNQARLYDVTAAQTVAAYTGVPGNGISQSGYNHATYPNTTTVTGRAYVTVASGTRTYRLEHRCQTSNATNGLGVESNFGESEIYSVVTIYKEAS